MKVDGIDLGGASSLLVIADTSVVAVFSVAVPKERLGILVTLNTNSPLRQRVASRSGCVDLRNVVGIVKEDLRPEKVAGATPRGRQVFEG